MSAYTEGPLRVAIDPTEPTLHCLWTDEEGVDQMSVLVARTCYAPASQANAERLARAWNNLGPVCEVLGELLFAAENADETGYVTDVGFLDLEALCEKARAALALATQKEAR